LLRLKVTVPTVPAVTGDGPRLFTLTRGENLRPLQFRGEVLAEVVEEKDARTLGGAGIVRVSHRVAIYRTASGGKFVTEFSSLDARGDRIGTAGVFDTLDAACDWFRRGALTTELMKKLGRWYPEFK
jgi:hypothetical protein